MEKHTILIVDDEPHILTSLKRILDGDDKNILVAKNAEEAWDILKTQGETEVVICDNKLPGMMGIEFLTKVKRTYPDAIRILITGYPDLSSAIDAINSAHIWRYLLKPIEVEELKILVKQSFDYHRIIKENRLLLQIARQQAEWLQALKGSNPQIVTEEMRKSTSGMDEMRVSEILERFIEKYSQEDTQDA